MTRTKGRRHKQLLNDLKGMREYRKLKLQALDGPCGELALAEFMV
jgi:hypothetical protein